MIAINKAILMFGFYQHIIITWIDNDRVRTDQMIGQYPIRCNVFYFNIKKRITENVTRTNNAQSMDFI